MDMAAVLSTNTTALLLCTGGVSMRVRSVEDKDGDAQRRAHKLAVGGMPFGSKTVALEEDSETRQKEGHLPAVKHRVRE
jgi:hypothetical protein